MTKFKNIRHSKYFNTFLWIVILIIAWEIGATAVAATKRSPENILPHLSGIIKSIISTDTINGSQTALQMVLINAQEWKFIRVKQYFIVLAIFISI